MFSEKLNVFLDDYSKNNNFFGVVRVTLKDRVIFQKNIGYADYEKAIPFYADSMFTFYSLSKPFLSIGIMRLYEEGKIEIDSHPSKYIPEAIGFDKEVTFRNMLHHTSGLPDFVQTAHFDKKYSSGAPEYLREQLKELSKFPNVFKPNTSGMYANINMVLCALAIENVTGISYAEYMKENVFKPLGMKTAVVDNKKLVLENRVKGYELLDNKVIAIDRCTDWMLGAGDIVGTVDDVYCLNLAIKHKKLLKEEIWEEILSPSPISYFGMGCSVGSWYGKKRITHNGGSVGFRTMHIQLLEDDFDIIILSNSGWGNARNDISEKIYKLYYGNEGSPSEEIEMDKGYI